MKLEPELEPPRARVDRRVLVLCGTAAIAFAGSAVLALRGTPSPESVRVYVPITLAKPIVIPVVQPPPDPDPDPPPHVVGGSSELAHFVDAWLTDPNAPPPAIEYKRGILFIESAEDRGDDGPYPKSAGPEAQRVCGSAAIWLRDHLHDRFARWSDLTCSESDCTYPGMEYAPDGRISFHRIVRDGYVVWAIDGWSQTYVAALGADYAEANMVFVDRASRRLMNTSCPGEPEGSY